MAGGVRQPPLNDAVDSLVHTGIERPRCPAAAKGDLETRLRVMGDKRVQGCQTGGRGRTSVDGVANPQRMDDAVDVGRGLPRHVLDCLQGGQRALGLLLVTEPGGARPNRDDVDRMAGGIVQVTCDPRTLFGDREAPLLLGFPLRLQSALPQLGAVRAT